MYNVCTIGKKVYTTQELNRLYSFTCEDLNEAIQTYDIVNLTNVQKEIIKKIIENYDPQENNMIEIRRELGAGASSVIYYGDISLENKLFPIVIKKLKRSYEATEQQEIELWNKLNTISEFTPNFLYFYGIIRCNDKRITDLTKLCIPSNIIQDNTYTEYLIIEYVQGYEFRQIFLNEFGITLESMKNIDVITETLKKMSADEMNTKINKLSDIAIIVLKQIALSLHIANKKLNFQHRDLDQRNCLIKIIDKYITNTYKIDEQIINIKTKYIPIIIDYGSAKIISPDTFEFCNDFFAYYNSLNDFSYYKRMAKSYVMINKGINPDNDIMFDQNPIYDNERNKLELFNQELLKIFKSFSDHLRITKLGNFSRATVNCIYDNQLAKDNYEIYKELEKMTGGSYMCNYFKKYKKYKNKYYILKYNL